MPPGLEACGGFCFVSPDPSMWPSSGAHRTPGGNFYPFRKQISGPFLQMSPISQPSLLG